MMPLLVMKVYVIKIAVRGVSPMVWRRLRIAADTSLAALHFIIQIIQGWGDDHLHQFHIYGKDYGITYEGSIGFPDKPETGSARRERAGNMMIKQLT
ncbi:plasmid pRiA4b ORF-3 family protein [Escherichia coli]|uniref:plasmid pRiA4b ORF-3 family protein n=1 Tax=Escherichia coli TaxID=562 RepID=UPI002227E3AC|nr:plasmid pRiA4b ORF-3 family protein [Escherichia coli]